MVSSQVRIDVLLTEKEALARLREDVRRGMTSRPRFLPPKYFYDQKGSRLFDRITRLPEYYLTRAEIEILGQRAGEVARKSLPVELIELGPGSSRKTRLLLEAMRSTGSLKRFLPVDISAESLSRMATDLTGDYPELEFHGIAGDFEEALDRIPPRRGGRLAAFLGSTIGNLDRSGSVSLLRRINRLLEPGDRFLLGVDLVKEVRVMEAAYDDAAGITARFNRNILSVVNRRLGADFRPRLFEHVAFFNRKESRVEMHLRARTSHRVVIAGLGMDFEVESGEMIHTENSYKYTREGVASTLQEAGLELLDWFVDPDRLFSLSVSSLHR